MKINFDFTDKQNPVVTKKNTGHFVILDDYLRDSLVGGLVGNYLKNWCAPKDTPEPEIKEVKIGTCIFYWMKGYWYYV